MIINNDNVIFSMSKNNEPVSYIQNGDTVKFLTCDCFKNQITNETDSFDKINWNTINPATGPVYIYGAEPGDILKIEIKKIELNRDYAIMATGKNSGVLGDELTDNYIYKVPIKEGKAFLPQGVEIDINPMIGVIGVAPKEKNLPCGEPCEHGGNMDCKDITAGTILYLPVNVSGALLAVGDLHAAMGDGEVSVTGLEISGQVELTVSVLKDLYLPTPMIEKKDSVSTIASAITLDDAAIKATKKMTSFIQSYSALSPAEIITLLSICGDLKICQIVDPQKTCRFELSKIFLNQLNISLE